MTRKLEQDFYGMVREWTPAAILMIICLAAFGVLRRQAHRDISANRRKTEFQASFPGLEAAARLSSTDREQVVRTVNASPCACGCGYTVASCLNFDTHCPERPKNLARIAKLITTNKTESGMESHENVTARR